MSVDMFPILWSFVAIMFLFIIIPRRNDKLKKRLDCNTGAHAWQMTDWNKAKYGPDLDDITNYTATYKYLYKCKCGEEKIVCRTALI